MAIAAFYPTGGATRISSTAASATAAIQPSTGGMQHAFVTNVSTLDAYYATGATTATARAATTVASSGSNVILQRTSQMIATPPSCWVSAITTAGQADLVWQPGTAGSAVG